MRESVDPLQEGRVTEGDYQEMARSLSLPDLSPEAEDLRHSEGAPVADDFCSDDAAAVNSSEDNEPFRHARQPVYEANPNALLGRQLVMTPWMLLDRLRDVQERTSALRQEACTKNWGAERRRGRTVNPLIDRLDELSDELAHTLYILWRNGLWMDARDGAIETRTDTKGQPHQVVGAPFTDGKPHGRPLPSDAPVWLRDLLGANLQTPAA